MSTKMGTSYNLNMTYLLTLFALCNEEIESLPPCSPFFMYLHHTTLQIETLNKCRIRYICQQWRWKIVMLTNESWFVSKTWTSYILQVIIKLDFLYKLGLKIFLNKNSWTTLHYSVTSVIANTHEEFKKIIFVILHMKIPRRIYLHYYAAHTITFVL